MFSLPLSNESLNRIRIHLIRYGVRLGDLDDLFQELQLRLWHLKSRGYLFEPQHPASYLNRIAERVAYDYYLQQKHFVLKDPRLCEPYDSGIERLELTAEIEHVTRELSEKQVKVISYIAQDFTMKETAKALGMSFHAVEKTLTRARKLIRR